MDCDVGLFSLWIEVEQSKLKLSYWPEALAVSSSADAAWPVEYFKQFMDLL